MRIEWIGQAGVPLAAMLITSCMSARTGPSVATLDWHPDVDQPIGQLEETLAKLEQQQPMNYTISNIGFLYDAKLYMLFHRSITALPETARAGEIERQRRWLQDRKRSVHAAYAEYEGGTFASFNAGRAFIAATKARIAELEERTR